ncbi:hypothetical protein Mapa_013130 [Marchantia paleacea]|nr:hypothetical protein Mapa_013130 [Marchantia paleacea]
MDFTDRQTATDDVAARGQRVREEYPPGVGCASEDYSLGRFYSTKHVEYNRHWATGRQSQGHRFSSCKQPRLVKSNHLLHVRVGTVAPMFQQWNVSSQCEQIPCLECGERILTASELSCDM